MKIFLYICFIACLVGDVFSILTLNYICAVAYILNAITFSIDIESQARGHFK